MHAYAGRQFVPFLWWSLVWPGREANSRPTVREADTLPTEPTRQGHSLSCSKYETMSYYPLIHLTVATVLLEFEPKLRAADCVIQQGTLTTPTRPALAQWWRWSSGKILQMSTLQIQTIHIILNRGLKNPEFKENSENFHLSSVQWWPYNDSKIHNYNGLITVNEN